MSMTIAVVVGAVIGALNGFLGHADPKARAEAKRAHERLDVLERDVWSGRPP